MDNLTRTPAYWREQLQLTPHVEGGAFRETYRAGLLFSTAQGGRNAATGIYFLLEHGEFSAFHRITSDEMWHFYDGVTLTIYEIEPSGNLITHKLGKAVHAGEHPQLVIKAGSWFASRVEVVDGFTLVGCTVSPGFDFADFELADRHALQAQYPMHADLISSLTR
jgi:uncharacterized protein